MKDKKAQNSDNSNDVSSQGTEATSGSSDHRLVDHEEDPTKVSDTDKVADTMPNDSGIDDMSEEDLIDGPSQDDDKGENKVNSSEEYTLDSFRFTLKRDGYSRLPYFSTEYNMSFLSYNFFSDRALDGLIEPYAPMYLTPKNPYDSSSHHFNFTVCSMYGKATCFVEDGQFSFPETSTSFTIPCEPSETYVITVTDYALDGKVISETSGNFMCMYVRREIQSLTEADLTSTMDALYTLWSLSDEEGQKLYGENFHNSTYFSSAHDFNAAWVDADHIHEGLGFIPQHIKLTNMVELAMQAVNPSVSMPYWDYTLEVAQGKALNESFMFTEDTFGTLAVPAAGFEYGFQYSTDSITDARITNGRWKDLKSEMNYAYPDLGNGFGFMRGAWNTNPSPYVSRFATGGSLPSCSAFYSFLFKQTDYLDFLYEAAYSPHASVHGAIGSTYGCDKMQPLLEAGALTSQASLIAVCHMWAFGLKELFRDHYIEPRTDCVASSMDEGDIDCGFTCVESHYNDLPSKIKQLTFFQAEFETLTDDKMSLWRDFICTGDGFKIFSGDHLESASPSDPSFWPIHPNLERLMHARMLSGGFANYTWPVNAKKDYVCDKAMCYEPDEQESDDTDTYDYFSGCCRGHYEHDQLLDFVNGDKNAGMGQTNAETLAATDPTSSDYTMTYVYDSLSWDHCGT